MFKTFFIISILCGDICAEDIKIDDLLGFYQSGSEIEGFSGTKLLIEERYDGKALNFKKKFYSDVGMADQIQQDEISGEAKFFKGVLIIAQPSGFYYRREGETDKKIILTATMETYYPEIVNGKMVLFREDAYGLWKKEKKVYDYGILVQTKKDIKGKLFYEIKPVKLSLKKFFNLEKWEDPFVNGPNK